MIDTGALDFGANQEHERVKEMVRVNRRWIWQHYKEYAEQSCFITNKAIMYTQMDLSNGLLQWPESQYVDHLMTRGGRHTEEVIDNVMGKLRKRKTATRKSKSVPYAICSGHCLPKATSLETNENNFPKSTQEMNDEVDKMLQHFQDQTQSGENPTQLDDNFTQQLLE